MPDPIKPAAIHQRWETLRDREDCDLSLGPEAVEKYLRVPESEIVRQRILESLVQFAEYRIREGPYHSGNEGVGDLAVCEGLETFLIPAVEEAYGFSEFLQQCPSADAFLATFKDDLKALLKNWAKDKPDFSGKPYTDPAQVRRAIPPTNQNLYAPFNITETAAFACRIIVHVLSLKYRPEEARFSRTLGPDFADDRLLKALSNAIDFLVESFQKGSGSSEEEKIVSATWDRSAGSGWSWTASPPGTPPLAPMLFFTSAAVDAFAEVELYLIRPARKNVFANVAPLIQQFWQEKQTQLRCLQLCVDMARRWTRATVLPNLTRNVGQHQEMYPDQSELVYVREDAMSSYEPQWKLAGLVMSPTVFYNNVYALQILLWSFADQTEDGSAVDTSGKSAILSAITLLVASYDRIPVVREVLGKFRHRFFLPGKKVFIVPDDQAKCEYLDAGFLPLLTRLLVLFVVYGVGDRNLLEPVIRDLYVELLQKRNRSDENYSALWSTDEVEVYSTQRSIQALTFYHAYAKGKERAEARRGDGGGDTLVLRNKTGMRVVLELVEEGGPELKKPDPPVAVIPEDPVSKDPAALFKTKFGTSFPGYAKNTPGFKPPPTPVGEEDATLAKQIDEFGTTVFGDAEAGRITDLAEAERVLRQLADLVSRPWDGKVLRVQEFSGVKRRYEGLIGGSPTSTGK